MSLKSRGIYIIGAKRTPFCKYGGSLRELPASYAFAAAAKDAMHTAKLEPKLVDQTVVGNVNYLSQCDGGKTPRYCGIYSGVPIERPALGVSKACGTGIQALITAAMDIVFGTSNICLTGGTDIMSSLPMLVRNVRFGTSLGTPYVFEDHIKTDLVDTHSGLSQTQLAELLARKYKIGREEMDEYALKSHLKWKRAQETKTLKDEIASLNVTLKKKEVLVETDEIPNINLDLQQLSQLKSVHQDGVVTNGNRSVPADGAAALLLASESAALVHHLTPLARLVSWSTAGVDLEHGGGAVPAVRRLLEEQQMSIDDVDLFEINETSASEVLAFLAEFHVDSDKVNVNGGGLALGNPVSATGARMVSTLVHQIRYHTLTVKENIVRKPGLHSLTSATRSELAWLSMLKPSPGEKRPLRIQWDNYGLFMFIQQRKAKRAIATSSCGGGQGVAVMIESI